MTPASGSTTSPQEHKIIAPEIWFLIFEQLDADNLFARDEEIQLFKEILADDHNDEECAVRSLDPLEQEAWHKARQYYAIDRASRHAATRLRLTILLLPKASAPLTWGVWHDKNDNRKEGFIHPIDNDDSKPIPWSPGSHGHDLAFAIYDNEHYAQTILKQFSVVPSNGVTPFTTMNKQLAQGIHQGATLQGSKRIDLMVQNPYGDMKPIARRYASVLRVRLSKLFEESNSTDVVIRIHS